MKNELLEQLMNRQEALLPELMPYVGPFHSGVMVHHPLLIEIFFDLERCAWINHHYKQQTEDVQKYFAVGDFHSYIFAHARPYRLDAFMRCVPPLASADYWREVARVWCDSENIHQHRAMWRRVWARPTAGRQYCMDEQARAALAALPDVIKVWRGVNHWTSASIKGFSWSLEREQGIRFAHRFVWGCRHALLVEGEVQKRHVLAYFSTERELVSMQVRPLIVIDITSHGPQ